ncbi:MAG: ATP-binding protein [Sandaracinaceae bacterium]|nr:ATP-binding protein [Sandaracinaceae bacterium]
MDVNAVLTGVLPMLRRLLGEDIEVQFEPHDVWETRIDISGLEQVIVNMAVNARDAMPRGGRLWISTHNVEMEEELLTSRREGLAPGRYVVLAISDDGVGIPPEIQEHIFEPFFTTKELGRGTGLGLATCWGVVRQVNGAITVYSELGRGTTFKVYLPRFSGTPGRLTMRAPPSAALAGNEAVLVVEDDPQVRALTVRALGLHGYDVLEASNRADAEEWVSRRGGDIRLVLADVVMPELSGPELVGALQDRLPHARVLYISGYTSAAVEQRGLIEQGAPMLEKPFTPELLARRVREVLDAPPS